MIKWHKYDPLLGTQGGVNPVVGDVCAVITPDNELKAAVFNPSWGGGFHNECIDRGNYNPNMGSSVSVCLWTEIENLNIPMEIHP